MRLRTSFGFLAGSASNLALRLLTILIAASQTLAYTASMLDLGIPSHVDFNGVQGGLADVLIKPMIDSSTIMLQAKNYLQGLEKVPICSSFAAKRLWQSCSTIKSTLGTARDADMLKDQSKQLFAARMALCEGAAARVAVPKACQRVSTVTGNSNDFNMAASDALEGCVKALRREDNYWTSYSNNLQPAATLCEASRLDIDREEMLEAMHQASILWPGIMRDFNAMQQQLKDFSDQQVSEQEKLIELQKENKDHVVQYHELQLSLLRRQTSEASEGLKSAIASLRDGVADAGGDVQKMHEGMGIFKENVHAANAALDEFSKLSATTYNQFTQSYQNDLVALSAKAHQLQEYMGEMNVEEVVKAVNGIALAAHFATVDLNSTMEAHLADLQYSLRLGEETVQTQERSLALSEEVSRSLQDLRQAVPLIDAMSSILDIFAALLDQRVQIELAATLFVSLLSCIFWLSLWTKPYALRLLLFYAAVQTFRVLLWLTEAHSKLALAAYFGLSALQRAANTLQSAGLSSTGHLNSPLWYQSCSAISATMASIVGALLTIAFLLLIRTVIRAGTRLYCHHNDGVDRKSTLPIIQPSPSSRGKLPPTRLSIDQQRYYRYRREMTVPPGY